MAFLAPIDMRATNPPRRAVTTTSVSVQTKVPSEFALVRRAPSAVHSIDWIGARPEAIMGSALVRMRRKASVLPSEWAMRTSMVVIAGA